MLQAYTQITAASYLPIDIETGYAPAAEIAEQIENWEAPKNIKDEDKIAERKAAFIDQAKAKSSLTDASPIVSICFKTNTGTCVLLSSMGRNKATEKPSGWNVMEFDTEGEMLGVFSAMMGSVTDEFTRIVGHNIIGFDLPKLRNRMVRNKVKLPNCLVPRFGDGEKNQPVYDTMKSARYFSQELSNQLFVSFDALAKALGLPIHKHLMDGSQVPAFAEQGRVDEILLYNALDVEREEAAFLMMTGA